MHMGEFCNKIIVVYEETPYADGILIWGVEFCQATIKIPLDDN
jgi:hypothetical protein